jgi:phospholipid transport system substrate-binding protein
MFKNICATLLAVSLILTPGLVNADPIQNPFEMVREVADALFKRITNEQVEIKKDPEILRVVVAEQLAPSINHKYAAGMVMGRYYTQYSPEQRERFYEAFQKYLVATYAGILTLYDDQEVVFEPASSVEDKKIVLVGVRVLDEGKPDIKIAFKLRRNSKTGEWSAFDMIAEGVSVLDSKRAELQGLIRQQGLDSVSELLLEKAAKPIVKKDLGSI